MLRDPELEDAYTDAWDEWQPSGDPPRGRLSPRMALRMLRGEMHLTDLDLAWANEANERRPAVIVSNDRANASASASATRLGRGVVTIVPVTLNVEQVHPYQVLLPAGERPPGRLHGAGEQIRSMSVQRLGQVVGRLPALQMAQLDDALRIHLQL